MVYCDRFPLVRQLAGLTGKHKWFLKLERVFYFVREIAIRRGAQWMHNYHLTDNEKRSDDLFDCMDNRVPLSFGFIFVLVNARSACDAR